MIYLILRKTGLKINHKRVERVYAANKMQLKLRKTRKKFKVEKRADHLLSSVPGKWLAVDFVIDSIGNKRQLKMLTAIDPVTNESPLIQPAFSMRGEQVAEVLDRKCSECGYPEFLQCDNGPEFRSRELSQWCQDHNIKQIFSRPGKPTDNCFIESFNGTLRNECLNVYYFSNISEAKRIIEEWRIDYNKKRPQKRFKGLTPFEYRNKLLAENLI
jgi:putative transposase